MAFTQEILDSIKDRLSFFDIASEFVQLKRSGRNYVGLCPFHHEKSPSFFIREEEGAYHCFGCGKKGSIFNFVMEMRGFNFPEAVKHLAKIAGVVLPDEMTGDDPEARKRAEHHRFLREVAHAASAVYESELPRAKVARDYLADRKVSAASIAEYHLGFAPPGWTFIQKAVSDYLQRSNQTGDMKPEQVETALLELGLLKRKQSANGESADRAYDALRDRIIFPITRSDGRVMAFGGRAMTSEANVPKYLNSPESPLYSKRKSLFGLPQALAALRRERHLFLVEGYFDVILLHQIGVLPVVATCGTAVTPDHAQVIKRLVEGVTIVFDGDPAGKKAASQCFPVFLNSGLDVDVVLLPEGHDPDSLARAQSPDAVVELLRSNRMPVADVFLNSLVEAESGGAGTALSAAATGRIAQRYASSVAHVKNPVEKEFLLKRGAEKLGVSIDSFDSLVRDETRKVMAKSSFSHAAPPPSPPPTMESAPPEMRAHSKGRPERRSVNVSRPGELPRAPAGRELEPLELLCKQLVISVLCEPSLADTVLDLSLIDSYSRALEPLKPLGDHVFAFVRDLRESGCRGVAELVADAKVSGLNASALGARSAPNLQALLAAHDLDGLGLLEESFRQSLIGGGAPRASVSQSAQALERLGHQVELSALRSKESSEGDEAMKLAIAQQKLERKRNLERIKTSENNGQKKAGPTS
ncbi:MAG: DNA primase [Bdellovibrionota bacterium]